MRQFIDAVDNIARNSPFVNCEWQPSIVLVHVDTVSLREWAGDSEQLAVKTYLLLHELTETAARRHLKPWQEPDTIRQYLVLLLDPSEATDAIAQHMTNALAHYVTTEEHRRHPHVVILDQGWNHTTQRRALLAAKYPMGLVQLKPRHMNPIPLHDLATATTSHGLTIRLLSYLVRQQRDERDTPIPTLSSLLNDNLSDADPSEATLLLDVSQLKTTEDYANLWELVMALLTLSFISPAPLSPNLLIRLPSDLMPAEAQYDTAAELAPRYRGHVLVWAGLTEGFTDWLAPLRASTSLQVMQQRYQFAITFLLGADPVTGTMRGLHRLNDTFPAMEHVVKFVNVASALVLDGITVDLSSTYTIAFARVYVQWRWGLTGRPLARSIGHVEMIVDHQTFTDWIASVASGATSDIGYLDMYVSMKYALDRMLQKKSIVERRIGSVRDIRALDQPQDFATYRTHLTHKMETHMSKEDRRRRAYFARVESPSSTISISTSTGVYHHT